ncbi:hypothetical protein NDU88_002459 [Pleurodeles waltl]|uniref:Uncharacterized protein n=1 Tax=Pleurodeles waltl TaxID=8319 RepID=A0AAV7WLA6_PLEWA|nr:hypothetical protein NDU88_002459 [Pleurodeles waltl]
MPKLRKLGCRDTKAPWTPCSRKQKRYGISGPSQRVMVKKDGMLAFEPSVTQTGEQHWPGLEPVNLRKERERVRSLVEEVTTLSTDDGATESMLQDETGE